MRLGPWAFRAAYRMVPRRMQSRANATSDLPTRRAWGNITQMVREGSAMKSFILAAGLAFAAGAALADPIEGVWQTEVDDGSYAHVTIVPCGSAFCGDITQSFKDGAAYQSENMGKQIVIDMVPAGDGSYEGKVWRPSNNKVYIGKIAVDGNSLKLRGCVAGGLLCAKQSWSRVN
jgi:uncharacterized protein (DUF2147 family)